MPTSAAACSSIIWKNLEVLEVLSRQRGHDSSLTLQSWMQFVQKQWKQGSMVSMLFSKQMTQMFRSSDGVTLVVTTNGFLLSSDSPAGWISAGSSFDVDFGFSITVLILRRISSSCLVASMNAFTFSNFLIFTISLGQSLFSSSSYNSDSGACVVYCTTTVVLKPGASKRASFKKVGTNRFDRTIEIVSSWILKVALRKAILHLIIRFSRATYMRKVSKSWVGWAVARFSS